MIYVHTVIVKRYLFNAKKKHRAYGDGSLLKVVGTGAVIGLSFDDDKGPITIEGIYLHTIGIDQRHYFFDATEPDRAHKATVILELDTNPIHPLTIDEGFRGSRRFDLHLESFFWDWERG